MTLDCCLVQVKLNIHSNFRHNNMFNLIFRCNEMCFSYFICMDKILLLSKSDISEIFFKLFARLVFVKLLMKNMTCSFFFQPECVKITVTESFCAANIYSTTTVFYRLCNKCDSLVCELGTSGGFDAAAESFSLL